MRGSGRCQRNDGSVGASEWGDKLIRRVYVERLAELRQMEMAAMQSRDSLTFSIWPQKYRSSVLPYMSREEGKS